MVFYVYTWKTIMPFNGFHGCIAVVGILYQLFNLHKANFHHPPLFAVTASV